jgi:hypothetical protein
MEDRPSLQSAGTGIVERAKAIVMQPKAEWPKIAGETTEPMKVLTGYVVPLALIGPIAALIGTQIFGINAFVMTIKPSLTFSITTAITTFVLSLVGVFVLAFVANFLSPKFGGKDDFPAAFRWVAYAMTASWIGGIFGLVPALSLIGLLFSLYSLYVLYLGASPIMAVPEDKTVGYTVVTVLAAIVLYIVVGSVTAAITGTMGLAATSADFAETSVDLGELGNFTVDGENQTIDLGELGRVEVNGDTATVTVDGQQIEVPVEAIEAARAAE